MGTPNAIIIVVESNVFFGVVGFVVVTARLGLVIVYGENSEKTFDNVEGSCWDISGQHKRTFFTE